MKTDPQVSQDVLAELLWEPSVGAEHIRVAVQGGIVTLSGHVSSYADKWNAERAVQRVAGVKALVVDMDVKLRESSRRTDADAISVEVQGPDVTLTGTVQSWSERNIARHSAWGAPGVRNVVDHITVVG